jgi:endonuclease YncB( thermonuclease family)
MTTEGRFCPTCGRRRAGYLRYCIECGYDFDELSPRPPEPIVHTSEPQPVPAALPTPPVLSAVTVARAVEPKRPPRWRLTERSVVRVAAVGVGALVVIGLASNALRPSTSPASTAAPSVALASPVVVESAVPSETVSEPTFRPSGQTQLAVVNSVVDGDTIRVDIDGEEYPLRYIGMDTPEPDATDPTAKRYADEATAANVALVEGEEVYLEKDVSETDRFGRLLRNVWIVDPDDGMVLVNLELVRRGYAQVATLPPDVKYVDLLTGAQDAARAEGLGLWGNAASGSASPSVPAED